MPVRPVREVFFVHTVNGREPKDWEPLKRHLIRVADHAKTFANYFGAADHGYIAGLLHDIGQYSDAFQAKLDGKFNEAPHSIAGAKLAEERYCPILGRMLAFAIAGHHGGLLNGVYRDGSARTPLQNQRSQAASERVLGHSAQGQRRLRRQDGGCLGGLYPSP